MNIQAVGLPEAWDKAVFRGEATANQFSVFSLLQDVVVSAHAVNAPRDIRYARRLIAVGRQPDPLELANLEVPLKNIVQVS